MTTLGHSLGNMLTQSRDVLARRNTATFEQHEQAGRSREALLYVALAGCVTGFIGVLDGVYDTRGFLVNLLTTVLGFLVLTYLVYWLGQRRGGTGTRDEVMYAFSLFVAPISVIGTAAIYLFNLLSSGTLFPVINAVIGLAMLYYNVRLAYFATQASLNLAPGRKVVFILLAAYLTAALFNALITFGFAPDTQGLEVESSVLDQEEASVSAMLGGEDCGSPSNDTERFICALSRDLAEDDAINATPLGDGGAVYIELDEPLPEQDPR